MPTLLTWINDPPVERVERNVAIQLALTFQAQMTLLATTPHELFNERATEAGGLAKKAAKCDEAWVYRFAMHGPHTESNGIAGIMGLLHFEGRLHIDYMATTPMLQGVGGVLVETAVRLSFERGFNGRVTLFAGNDQSEEAFERLGFTRFEDDDGPASHELRPERSDRWVARGGIYVLNGAGRYLSAVTDT
jgi:GNAT superfamily N-acetyltransferase